MGSVGLSTSVYSGEDFAKHNASKARRIIDQRIIMRDGIALHGTTFLPSTSDGPVPVVMQMTPYGIDAFIPSGQRFADAGLAFTLIDCRGRGNSEGEFEMFETDITDTLDAIDWLTSQSWCDGQVSMHGGSYSGINQWIAAKARPAALKGIAPWGAAYPGIDVPPGGVPFVGHLSWFVLTGGRDTQWQLSMDTEYWFQELAKVYRNNGSMAELARNLGVKRPTFYKILEDPFYAMREMSFLPTPEEMAAIDIPVLSTTGYYDSTHAGTLYHFQQHERFGSETAKTKHHLVLTPWHHAGMDGAVDVSGLQLGPAAAINMAAIRLEWYRWIFGLGDKPNFLADRIVYYMTGAEEWRSAPSLEAIVGHTSEWFVGSAGSNAQSVFHSGKLTPEPQSNGHETFVADPFDSSIIEVELMRRKLPRHTKQETAILYPDPIRGMHLQIAGEDPTDQAFAHNLNGQGLVYHSDPLEHDLEVAGIPQLEMWLTLSTPDTDVVALLSEIRPEEGQSVLIWSNILRLRYRNSWREPELANPGEPFKACFFIPRFTARRVLKGSRLRLVLRSPGSIHFQKNLNSGKPVFEETAADAERCEVRVHHSDNMQTRLLLPIEQSKGVK